MHLLIVMLYYCCCISVISGCDEFVAKYICSTTADMPGAKMVNNVGMGWGEGVGQGRRYCYTKGGKGVD